jgi:hypothetical protein
MRTRQEKRGAISTATRWLTTEASRQLKSDVKPRVAVEGAHFQLSIAKRAGKSF